jgi:hypothetical protein
MKNSGASTIQRMGEGDGRVNELQSMAPQGQASEEWRSLRERVNGGAHIMSIAREGESSGAGAAADMLPAFQQQHSLSILS